MLLLKAYLCICIKTLKRAKKLYSDVVPKAVDEYLTCIDKFDKENKAT